MQPTRFTMNTGLTDLAKFRLSSQQLCGTNLKTAQQMVRWFGAVQGQEYAQTKWGLGLRLPELDEPDIEQELVTGKILRTHLLRPTWHFVAAPDIRWLLELTAPQVNRVNAYMYRKLELDEPVFNRCNELLISLLEGGKQLTRAAVNETFQQHKIEARGHRLSYIMMYAELAGIVCSGARQGNQFTYALLDEQVPAAGSYSREEALAELTRRYFSSRGPATLNDFATWSGLARTACKSGMELIRSSLEKITLPDNDYYFIPPLPLLKEHVPALQLLPVYDEYVMGYRDRSAFFEFRKQLRPSPPVYFDSIIIDEGQQIGTWRRTLTGKTVDLELAFFRPLSARQDQSFRLAVRRLEAFTKRTVTCAFPGETPG